MSFVIPGVPKFVDRVIHVMGIALVVSALLLGMASTGWFRQVLEHRIQASMQEATGGKVEIIGMSFHPLTLRISARRLIVQGLEKKSEPPLFSAQSVTVGISPATLLRFRVLLRTLSWQQAALHVQTYPDGSTNLPRARATPGEETNLRNLMDLRIRRLNLAHTTVAWNNRVVPLEVAARNVAIQIRLSHGRRYLGTLASSNTVINWNARTLPALSFATTLQLSSDCLQVSSLSWQIQNLRGQANGTFRWQPQLAGEFAFRSNGGLQGVARSLGIRAVQQGYLFADGKGTYGDSGLAVQGRLEARQLELTLPQFRPGTVSLASRYVLENHLLRLDPVTVAGLGGRAQGAATVSLGGGVPTLRLESSLNDVRLNALLRALPQAAAAVGLFHPHATIHGRVRVDWSQPAGLRGKANLQLHAPQEAGGGLPLTGHVQGSVATGRETRVTLDNAAIATPHSTVDARGSFGTTESSLAVKVVTSDFDDWRPLARILIETRKPFSLKLRSKAVFTGAVSGTFRHPEIEGHIEAGAFDYGGWPWDAFRANILGSPERTRISDGRLKLGASTLTLDAQASLVHWTLQRDSQIRLKASARETPVAGLRAALNLKPSMRGLLTGQVQAVGTLENLSGEGEFAVEKGEFAGIPFDLLSAKVRASGSSWEVHDLKVIDGQGHAAGWMRLDPVHQTFSAQLHGKDFPLAQLHLLHPESEPLKAPGGTSGLVSFDLSGEGSFDNARVQSTVAISQLAWKGRPLGNVQGSANWQGRQIQLRLEGEGAAGKIQLSGNIVTRGDWPLQLSGQYSSFRLDPWIEQIAGHTLGAEITVSGSMTMQGPLRQPKRITASSQMEHLEIDFPELKMQNERPLQLRYAESRLTLEQFRVQGPATNLEVGGTLRFAHPATLDLTVKGKTNATLLSLLSNKIQATGESTLQVRIGGRLAHPQLDGTVEIKDVNLGYGELPFRVNALNGTIKLQKTRAVISSLKGTIGGGTVNLSGFAALQDVLRYRMRTTLSQVRVRYPADFTTLLDGKLLLQGTTERGQLNGDITIRNVFANENLSLMDFIAGNNKPRGGSTLGVGVPFASNVSVNVQISSARPVRIETRNLRVVADVDTRVQGTLALPVIVGNVYLRSGQTIFRGNRYTLSRGEISMTNPFETEPNLDIQVQTRIDKYELTLEVSGPLDRIRFSYRSDPPLPSEDILSLLAFGYSRRLEEFAPATRNPFSSVGASALLSQALSSQVTGRVQRLFGVSRVKLDPYSNQPGTLGGPVLTIEQQLSPDLTLTYQTTTANSQYRVFEFEWTVNPRMAIRGFRDQNGIFGLELKFRKRFK